MKKWVVESRRLLLDRRGVRLDSYWGIISLRRFDSEQEAREFGSNLYGRTQEGRSWRVNTWDED